MTAVPVVLLVTAASALGAYLLLLWFQRTRRPVLIGAHVLLGFASAESLVVFLHLGGPDETSPVRRLALIGGGFLAAAIASGLLAPLFGRASPASAHSLLAVHVTAGLAGFLIVLAFFSQL